MYRMQRSLDVPLMCEMFVKCDAQLNALVIS